VIRGGRRTGKGFLAPRCDRHAESLCPLEGQDTRANPAQALVSKNDMLKKIDCIMIRVEDVEAAASYYADVFGLHRRWSDEVSIGLGFEESDAEVVIHHDPNIPSSVEVYYLVENVITA
jgi:Glyoxalase/Bleomycin resistance protein/Dioxygenase superfamily